MSLRRAASRALALALWSALLLLGCPGTQGRVVRLGPPDEDAGPAGPPQEREILTEERTLSVPVAEGITASLGALLVRPKEGRGPAILMVPGGGDISRRGTRPGDGVSVYAKPADVHVAWAEALARRGALVLTWDKRSCGPNDDPLCTKNPQDDLDAAGPVALAKDVDAACALVRGEGAFDGRIVLFAHGQAGQVALSASCAREAAALVLLAPIPRGVDEVIVAGIKDRARDVEKEAAAAKDPATREALREKAGQLRSLAGTREAEFASMKAGRFAPTARVGGATLAFWKGWIELTGKTAALVDAGPAKKIVVLGELDHQYGSKDRVRIRALSPEAYVEVKGADHHLLSTGRLLPATVDQVGAALDAALQPAAPPTG
ncbi:MAG: alpha/beta fold hydrolase [Deltaproteobacteria bacterium]|nr:alpha/beta fold hydrolase [Deltaproteobacteria bacterium]